MGVDDLIHLLERNISVILNADQGSHPLKGDYLVSHIGGVYHVDRAKQDDKERYLRESEFIFSEKEFKFLLEMIGKDEYSVTLLKPEQIKIPASASVGF